MPLIPGWYDAGMENKRELKKFGVGLTIVAIIVIAAMMNARSPIVLDVKLEDGDTSNPFPYSPVNYWADSEHVVVCVQDSARRGDGLGDVYSRRLYVYEARSGRHWRLQSLDANGRRSTTSPNNPIDYMGLSQDRKRLFVDCGYGRWYTTSAPTIMPSDSEPKPTWLLYRDLSKSYTHSSDGPPEISFETPNEIPILDKMVNVEARSLSPDGQHIAWLDNNPPAERFEGARIFLIKYDLLHRTPPHSAIWVSDKAGHHARCIATLDEPQVNAYDLRWSPDGKFLSCSSVSQGMTTVSNGVANYGRASYRLTIVKAMP